MKLQAARVRSFRNVIDSGDIAVTDRVPGREYVLLAGRTEELTDVRWASEAGLGEPGLAEPANLIWPEYRS